MVFSQCASYAKHRASDIQDILTLGIEKESYGLGFRVSILPIGFFFQSKQELTKGYGLRGGEFGSYSTKQLLFGFGGGESFYHGELLKDANGKPLKSDGMFLVSDKRSNLKSHDLKYLQVLKSSPSQRRKRQREKDLRSLAEELSEKSDSSELLEQLPKEKLKPHGYASHYPYQVEIFLGLYYGLRFGLNFAEAFDAIFGFFKIDILEDDIQGEIKLEEL
ncbi:MAG: hypothetical protein N3A69_03865 [Leptospiraceae bacterium]|nr:hypothetical protein [Leptospiraceae bacterium]